MDVNTLLIKMTQNYTQNDFIVISGITLCTTEEWTTFARGGITPVLFSFVQHK